MLVVVLDGEFRSDGTKNPQDGVGPVRSDSRVPEHLDVLRGNVQSMTSETERKGTNDGVAKSEVELGERHRNEHSCDEGHDGDLDALLVVTGKDTRGKTGGQSMSEDEESSWVLTRGWQWGASSSGDAGE